MPYNYNFRVLVDSNNCLSTFQFTTEKEAMEKIRKFDGDRRQCSIYPIKHNTDPMRADYEYRFFDIVQLENQVGMVLCPSADDEPEFHGFRPDIGQALDYVDEYWYQKDKRSNRDRYGI